MAHGDEGAAFYRRREAQELAASEKATDPMIRRLHWEMAQRYAFLATEAEAEHGTGNDIDHLPAGTVSL